MEKYIVIAHSIDFIVKTLSEFAKSRGYKVYGLESDDDIAFRMEDLRPAAVIFHASFTHSELSPLEITSFLSPEVKIINLGSEIIAGKQVVDEPIDPYEFIEQLIDELESINE